MFLDEEYEKIEKQRETEMKKQWEKSEQLRIEKNNQILQIPEGLSKDELMAYQTIVEKFKQSIKYKLTETDVELIWQYCQLKILRDRAWKNWNKNPERYIRIVIGISNDGKTPKVTVKENEHYKTLLDTNRHLEKILRDLRLTPDIRSKR